MGDVYRVGRKWYGCYKDHLGIRRQKALSQDKQTARRLLRKLESDSQLIAAGLMPLAEQPVKPLLDAWTASLRAVSDRHAENQTFRAGKLLADLDTLQQITASVVSQRLAALPVGDVTRRYYLQAVRQFTGWLVRHGHLGRDPLASVDLPRGKHLTRRCLTCDEINRLLVCERWPRYAVALGTGFRVSELQSLTAAAFTGTHVHLAAEHAKNGQAVWQPLPEWLQEMLADWLPGRVGTLFPRGWSHAARTLRSDAGADDVCFHCLRHTYITSLVAAGLPPKTVQLLARHSDFRLTFDLYTHLPDESLSCALRAWQPKWQRPGENISGSLVG